MILLFVGFIWFGFVEIEKVMTLMWTEVEIPNMMALYIQTSHCYWMWDDVDDTPKSSVYCQYSSFWIAKTENI